MLAPLFVHPNEFGEDLFDFSEDCLYLKVYTPAGAAAGAKLPVSSSLLDLF